MRRSLGIVLGIAMMAVAVPSFAASLGTAASTVIPATTQQIINVDYRKMNNAPSALALKKRVLPDALRQFEQSLRGVGINPDTDVDTLTFAAFRQEKDALRVVGIAQGNFARTKVLKKLRLQKVTAQKYRGAFIYPMASGQSMTFLDDNTLLFGDQSALHTALDTRDGELPGLSTNSEVSDLVANADAGTVWSVLDAKGTQHMMRQSLGDAARLADYDTVKKRIHGSYYTADFDQGVDFDLTVLTADSMTASTLSTVVKAGMLYRKMNAQAAEKVALDSTEVQSDNDRLKIHFKADDKRFESLLNSDLFSAVSQ
jgi:hypothetical protein